MGMLSVNANCAPINSQSWYQIASWGTLLEVVLEVEVFGLVHALRLSQGESWACSLLIHIVSHLILCHSTESLLGAHTLKLCWMLIIGTGSCPRIVAGE